MTYKSMMLLRNEYLIVVVTVDFILFMMSTGQCKMQTVDCRVQTGGNT